MSLDAYDIQKYLRWRPSSVRARHMYLKGSFEYLVAWLALLYSIGGAQMGSVCSMVTFGQVG